MSDLTCSGCGKGITHYSKTGRCLPCARVATARDPERRAAASEAMRLKWAEPGYRERTSRKVSEGITRKLAESPEAMEKLRERGREMHKGGLWREYMVAGSETKRKVGKVLTERALGWCPEKYRDEYRNLMHAKRMPAAEAKAVMLGQIAADLAKMTQFERQMLAIQQGRGIVSRPNLTTTYDYTLAGGSPL